MLSGARCVLVKGRGSEVIRPKRALLQLSMPISFVRFLSELLGKPSQRHSARRSVPGSGVQPFQQPVVHRERDLNPVATLIFSANARSAIAMHVQPLSVSTAVRLVARRRGFDRLSECSATRQNPSNL
jgi:hypothetical protein